MKTPLLILPLLAATLIAAARAAEPAPARATLPEAPIVQRLRAATAGDMPGVAVLIARDGRILYQGGFGYADIARRVPITPATKFRIGSITKQFTAAAILRLAEDGKLAISDPLSKYFPDYPHGDQITLRHLLTHTSGIFSYTDDPDLLRHITEPVAPDQLIASLRDKPARFAPGAGFYYDNSGYFLLGVIVARVSGQSYADYLRATFFEPLGMQDTGVYVNRAPPAGAAIGYSWVNDHVVPALDWDMSWAGGAGALYSTVGDLLRWNEALFGGRVVNAASLKAMTTPVELPPDVDGMRYGFGLLITTYKRLPVVSHGGGLPGWSSELMEFPQQHCTVVALANAMPGIPNVGPLHLTEAVASRFLAAEIKQAPAPVVTYTADPKAWADYVGQYDYRTGILTVSTEGGRLFAQLTGQRRFELVAIAADKYVIAAVDAELDFLRDARGRVVAIHHGQNGQGFRAPRLGDADAPRAPAQLDAFVGKYQYGPNAVLTVTRHGRYLFAQLTGQPRCPIFPVSETVFAWHIVPAKVQFVKDAAGKVVKAVHTQNGRTLEAPRIED